MNTPLMELFLSRVITDTTPENHWLWQGEIQQQHRATTSNDYAIFAYLQNGKGTNKRVFAHRYAYDIFVQPLSNTENITNICGMTTCVNPEHWTLALLSTRDVCRNGHEIKEDTLTEITRSNGKKTLICVVCRRQTQARYQKRKAKKE